MSVDGSVVRVIWQLKFSSLPAYACPPDPADPAKEEESGDDSEEPEKATEAAAEEPTAEPEIHQGSIMEPVEISESELAAMAKAREQIETAEPDVNGSTEVVCYILTFQKHELTLDPDTTVKSVDLLVYYATFHHSQHLVFSFFHRVELIIRHLQEHPWTL